MIRVVMGMALIAFADQECCLIAAQNKRKRFFSWQKI